MSFKNISGEWLPIKKPSNEDYLANRKYDPIYISDWIHTSHMMNDVVQNIPAMVNNLDVVIMNFAILHNLCLCDHTSIVQDKFDAINFHLEALLLEETENYNKMESGLEICSKSVREKYAQPPKLKINIKNSKAIKLMND